MEDKGSHHAGGWRELASYNREVHQDVSPHHAYKLHANNTVSLLCLNLLDVASICATTRTRHWGYYLQLETALVLGLQASIDHLDCFLPLVCPLCILLVILDVVQLQVCHEGDDLVHPALLQ